MTKIWANSADSHFLEPADLFEERMPASLASRLPRSEKSADGKTETVYIDGEKFERRLPQPIKDGEFAGETIGSLSSRPPGAGDAVLRLKDLDQEGIWGEITFPSLGMWGNLVKDPELVREGAKVVNDWAYETLVGTSPRYVPTATIPLVDVQDAVAEVQRAAGMGYFAAFLPVSTPTGTPDWNEDHWEPLWAALEETGLLAAFHIGTDTNPAGGPPVMFRGPGGAILNYVETSYGGQRAATKMITGGALLRHPKLKILIAEGGASWAPALGDRMDEAYRQHGMFVRPKLDKLPSQFIREQVYVSFQHDVTAVAAYTSMGYKNIMWGSDYPHLEGTYGHTQKTLSELFDGVDPKVVERITKGTFEELFPKVPKAPANEK